MLHDTWKKTGIQMARYCENKPIMAAALAIQRLFERERTTASC